MRVPSSDRRQALALLALPPALAALSGSPATALEALHSPSADALGSGPLVGAIALVAWALTGWLIAVVAVTFGLRLPGALGRGAQQALGRLAPMSVRALVRTATGVAVAGTVLLSGATAQADPSGTNPSPSPASSASLDWPTTPPAPTVPTAAPVAPTALPPTPPAQPIPTPAVAAARSGVTAPPVTAAPTSVVVQPGDCLWHLAAQSLGPDATPRQIATAWPSWWSANRAVIGEDPNLLRPGTVLSRPDSRRNPS